MASAKVKRETAAIRVGGMTCVSCEEAVRRKLNGAPGVKVVKVSYNDGNVVVKYDVDRVTLDDIYAMIGDAGYEAIGADGGAGPKTDARRTAGMLIIIAAIYIVLQQYGVLNYLVPSTLADVDMSHWLMFVIGLTTSVHCVAMCGGINLSQCLRKPGTDGDGGKFSVLRPSILYNFGRVISYTVTGGVVGAIGSAFSLSLNAQGVLKLVAGVFMVMMGITMLDLFPGLRGLIPKMPKFFAGKINAGTSGSKGPLIVGLLNGLMPCGPLQAAQIYALSTGSPVKGALAMTLFSLGTVPLMFGLGTFGSAVGRKSSRKVMTAGAVMVAVLGLCMLSQSWNLFGLRVPPLAAAAPSVSSDVNVAGDSGKLKIDIDLGPQIVNSTLQPYAYPSIKVEPNRPVRWIINAPPGSINGCNDRFIIREYGIEYRFKPGENIIEFTPAREGRVPYSCWMGMITATITVTRDAASPENENDADSSQPRKHKCC